MNRKIKIETLPVTISKDYYPISLEVHPSDYNVYHGKKIQAEDSIIYAPKLYSTAEIVMDEDGSIGSCTCSYCHKSTEPWYKYCQNCGARIKEAVEKED